MNCRAFALVLVGVAILATSPTLALDPKTADSQVKEALANGPYSFCKRPPSPLPARAQALCGISKDIPDCDAFVEACQGKKGKEPSSLSWLGEVLAAIANIGIWVLVALVIAALAIPIVQAMLRARRNSKLRDRATDPAHTAAEKTAPEETVSMADAERLLRQAEELARQGKLDRALFAFLHASLRALDQRGAIRIERHRTHGEYVRACKEDGARLPLRELVREVDRVKFGGAHPDGVTVSRAKDRAMALVRMVPMALLALGLLGCGEVQRMAMGADPSEDGLLLDLLRRQGAEVSRLGGSLATLTAPQPDELGPVVIVDAERVALEEETRAHLISWIEKGGVLVLAGSPEQWPKELGAKGGGDPSRSVHVRDWLEEEDEDDAPIHAPAPPADTATIARGAMLVWPDADKPYVARLDDGALYGAIWRHGTGAVLGVANDDLFTNAGLARPGNARALLRMLAHLDRNRFQVARPEDGIAPPSNPLSALVQAGLGKALLHAAAAVVLLFLAYGIRHARPRPAPPPARRAFAEHVQATGALYARTRIAAHALVAYMKYADGMLRARMPRGSSDPAAFLALRSGVDPATCKRLWSRGVEAAAGAPECGDELPVLKELSGIVAIATRRD